MLTRVGLLEDVLLLEAVLSLEDALLPEDVLLPDEDGLLLEEDLLLAWLRSLPECSLPPDGLPLDVWLPPPNKPHPPIYMYPSPLDNCFGNIIYM